MGASVKKNAELFIEFNINILKKCFEPRLLYKPICGYYDSKTILIFWKYLNLGALIIDDDIDN